MIQDKIFFDEKDPTGLSYNTPFTVFGSYEGRLWSKTPNGEVKYYTQNSDLSVYAITGSNSFDGNQTVTGSLTVTEGITGTATTSSYVEYTNVANKPALVSGSAQIADFGIFATTGSNGFNGSQSITGSLTVTGQVVAQTLNVQQVTSSIVYSSGSNVFGNELGNTQQFTGSVGVTGSLTVAGDGTFIGSVTSVGGLINGSDFRYTPSGNTEGLPVLVLKNPSSGVLSLASEIIGNAFVNSNSLALSVSNTTSGRFNALTLSSTGAATFSSSVTAGDGTQTPASDATITIRKGVAFAGLDFKSTRTSGNIGGLRFYNSDDTIKTQILAEVDSSLVFYTNTSSPRMRITSDGNVGIGTASPNTRLEVLGQSDSNYLRLSGDNASGARALDFTSFTVNGFVGSGHQLNAKSINGTLSFATVGTERMRITSGGDVGIGTDSPGAKLDVNGSFICSSKRAALTSTSYSSFSSGNANYPITFASSGGTFVSETYIVTVSTVDPSSSTNRRFAQSIIQIMRNNSSATSVVHNLHNISNGSIATVTISAVSLTASGFTLRVAFSGASNATIMIQANSQSGILSI